MSREVPLPRKVEIGSYEYTMQIVPPDDPILDDEDGMTTSEDTRKIISISSSLGLRRRLEIVFHELTHAINWTHDIYDEAPGDEEDMVSMPEEDLAAKYGLVWSQFLLDNPRFQRWLTYTLNRIRKERKDG